jgi:hypothetical protein
VLLQEVVTPWWLVVTVENVLFCVEPVFRKRQSSILGLESCITGKYHKRFCALYRMVIIFLPIGLQMDFAFILGAEGLVLENSSSVCNRFF